MAPRRRQRLHSFPGHNDGSGGSQNVDKLAFKYMMCKVQSSTDSESEISPRWSDTSTLGCVSSAPESGTVQRTLLLSHKPAARHPCYTQFLDPYDGSSEDSDESSTPSRRPRQQGGGIGGCRFLGRSRRFSHHHSAPASLRESVKDGRRDPTTDQPQQHLTDVQMRSGSDSELWVCELEAPSSLTDRSGCTDPVGEMLGDQAVQAGSVDSDVHCRFDDSGVFTTRSSTPCTPVGEISFQLPDGTSERSPSPCTHGSLYKRKLTLPGAEVVDLEEPRKKQCVNMEEEQGERVSL